MLGPEYPSFLEALAESPPVSIRLNRRKPVEQWSEVEQVPWHPKGRYLPERPVFTLDPFLHAGAYYVQDASSMFIAEAIRQLVDLQKPLRVLDLCAAPGGKSTLIADLLNEDSLLVANEVIHSRYPVLRENLIKWGFPNIVTTRLDPAAFSPLKGYFDIVLVDAPCSGEGLFRKDPAAVKEWSEEQVSFCALRQRRILEAAQALVKPEGFLLYSTCTYNEIENRQHAKQLEAWGFSVQEVRVPEDWNILVDRKEEMTSYAFFPHRIRGEGFFLAIFRKEEGRPGKVRWSGKNMQYSPADRKGREALAPWFKDLENQAVYKNQKGIFSFTSKTIAEEAFQIPVLLGSGQSGFQAGSLKKQQFIPSHELAMSGACSPAIPSLSLDRNAARLYLKKEEFPLPEVYTPDWRLVNYQDLPLGWIKLLARRANNYYPKEWRIRMDLPTNG